MNLQSILQFFFGLPILPELANNPAYTCRCLHGQPCWPDATKFAVLTNQISQPLIHPTPPASACYPLSEPSGDCSVVIANYRNGVWRSDQPGATQNTNFETFTGIFHNDDWRSDQPGATQNTNSETFTGIFHNDTISACYLDTTLNIPCGQGSVPPIGVDARSENDVQAAVNFAKQHNLKLVVKNTGHDLLGRSTARGGFLLWTHNMKQAVYNPTFVPEGAPVTAENTFDAITLGAGVQWHDAYGFAQSHGRTIVGGASPTVGAAGGWVMGGGHSALSPMFGLGVDNVLQFTIVLSDGSLVTTNSYQHPDLFWALRGGGGGTYGVVTSVSYKTYPIFPFTLVSLNANFTSPDIAQTVSTELIRLHPMITDLGWSTFLTLSNSSLAMFLVATNASLANTDATFLPFVKYVEQATGSPVQTMSIPIGSFYELYLGVLAENGGAVGNQVELASRLLPRSLAETDPAKAAKILLSLDGGVGINSIAGGAVSRVDPDSTGLNPSWRKALSEVYIAAYWPEGSTVDFIFQQIDKMKRSTLILDKLTTDSGSYLNEGSLHELDFKKSFFGSHYDKLKLIKDKYDPTSLFVVPAGVGSDDWDRELICKR